MLKPLMSKDTQRPVKPLEPEPMRRGPSTRDLNPDLTPKGLTPFAYAVKHALPSEWAAFQKQVAARVLSEPTHVWEKCNACGRVNQRPYRRGNELTKAGQPCVSCNYARYDDSPPKDGRLTPYRPFNAGGGFMRDMTAAEVKAHLDATAKAKAEGLERTKRASLYARNLERQAAGLTPWTMAEYEAAQNPERLKRDRVADYPVVQGQTERMARAGILKSPRPALELVQGPAGKPVVAVNVKGRKGKSK